MKLKQERKVIKPQLNHYNRLYQDKIYISNGIQLILYFIVIHLKLNNTVSRKEKSKEVNLQHYQIPRVELHMCLSTFMCTGEDVNLFSRSNIN